MRKTATLKVYKGARHSRSSALKDQVSADLLEFFKSVLPLASSFKVFAVE